MYKSGAGEKFLAFYHCIPGSGEMPETTNLTLQIAGKTGEQGRTGEKIELVLYMLSFFFIPQGSDGKRHSLRTFVRSSLSHC